MGQHPGMAPTEARRPAAAPYSCTLCGRQPCAGENYQACASFLAGLPEGFAAIPAVIAYNLFTSRIGQLDARYRTFADEFAGILERGLRHGGER